MATMGNFAVDRIAELLAKDAATFNGATNGPNGVCLLTVPFSPTAGLVVDPADIMNSNGLVPINLPQADGTWGLDPNTLQPRLQPALPTTGVSWTLTSLPSVPTTIYGWVLIDSDSRMLLARRFDVPIVLSAIGQIINESGNVYADLNVTSS